MTSFCARSNKGGDKGAAGEGKMGVFSRARVVTHEKHWTCYLQQSQESRAGHVLSSAEAACDSQRILPQAREVDTLCSKGAARPFTPHLKFKYSFQSRQESSAKILLSLLYRSL